MRAAVGDLIVFRDKGGLSIARVDAIGAAKKYTCQEYSRRHHRWMKVFRRVYHSWVEAVLPGTTRPDNLCERITVLENKRSAARRAANQIFEQAICNLSKETDDATVCKRGRKAAPPSPVLPVGTGTGCDTARSTDGVAEARSARRLEKTRNAVEAKAAATAPKKDIGSSISSGRSAGDSDSAAPQVRCADARSGQVSNVKSAPLPLDGDAVAKITGDRPAYGKRIVRVPILGKLVDQARGGIGIEAGKIDLNIVPSSMEQRAASWSKGRDDAQS